MTQKLKYSNHIAEGFSTVRRIAQAQKLAEELNDVLPSELKLIKQRIAEWANTGDNFAKGYVIRFAYCGGKHNSEIVNKILSIIELGK